MKENDMVKLGNEFSETISNEICKRIKENNILHIFKNSDGNYAFVFKNVAFGSGTVNVKATFIPLSSGNYKCNLELEDAFLSLLNVKLKNKYEGSIFMYSVHNESKPINVVLE